MIFLFLKKKNIIIIRRYKYHTKTEHYTTVFYREKFIIFRKKFYADYNVEFMSTASSHLFQSHQSHSGRSQRAEVENQ